MSIRVKQHFGAASYGIATRSHASRTLESYSWAELKEAAEYLSELDEEEYATDPLYMDFRIYMVNGEAKNLVYDNISIPYGIWAVCQKHKADGTGRAGLTLGPSYPTVLHQDFADNTSFVADWSASTARATLNSTVLNKFPVALQSLIEPVISKTVYPKRPVGRAGLGGYTLYPPELVEESCNDSIWIPTWWELAGGCFVSSVDGLTHLPFQCAYEINHYSRKDLVPNIPFEMTESDLLTLVAGEVSATTAFEDYANSMLCSDASYCCYEPAERLRPYDRNGSNNTPEKTTPISPSTYSYVAGSFTRDYAFTTAIASYNSYNTTGYHAGIRSTNPRSVYCKDGADLGSSKYKALLRPFFCL